MVDSDVIDCHGVGRHAVADYAGTAIRSTIVQPGVRDLGPRRGAVDQAYACPVPGQGWRLGRGEGDRVLRSSDRDQLAQIGVADLNNNVTVEAQRDTWLDGQDGAAVDLDRLRDAVRAARFGQRQVGENAAAVESTSNRQRIRRSA